MAKKKKGKRRGSMTAGTKKAAQAAKTGISYLNLPKGFKLFREEAGKIYKLNHIPYVVKDIKKHPDGQHIDGDIWWKLPYKKHTNVGPDKADFVCPRTFGRKCKLCDDRAKLYKDPDGDEEIAKLLKPKDRVLYIVEPIKSKDYDEKPHLWDISYHNYQKQLEREFDFDEELECPANIDDGSTLIVRFIEEQLGKNKFPKADNIKFKTRDALDEDMVDDMPDLMDCLVELSDKQISNMYKGIDDISGYDDEPEEEEEEETSEEDEDIKDMDKDELLEFAEENDIELTKKEKKLKEKKLRKLIQERLEEEEEEDEPEEEEEEEAEYDADEILEMSKKELNAIVKEEGLKIKAKDKKKIGNYRDAVIEALGLEVEEEEEDDEPEEGECPHGHIFGDDNGEHDECSDCDLYDDCLDAMD